MPVVDVRNLEGKTVGRIELPDDVFAARINAHLLHESVRHHLRGERAGTHKTKDKSEVSGSGKKLWKQKGTGRARIGSVRSPLWRHGGTVHGPVPRSYDYALPKKMVAGALRSALSAKLAEDKLTVVDAFALGSHKTKEFRQALSKLDAETRTILLIDNSTDVNLERASRNLAGVTLLPSTALEPYDLLRHERLMLSREAVARLSRSLSANPVEEPVQIEPAAAKAKTAAPEKHAEKAAPAKAAAKKQAAPKAAKKPATKKEKPKAKPKAKKG